MPQAWGAGSEEVVSTSQAPRDRTACFRRVDNTIRLSGAVNETVAFEFVLSATKGAAVGVEVSVSDLAGEAGTIGKDAFHIYRHWPVTIERYPNWYLRSVGLREKREIPDALVPIEARNFGQPFTIAGGASLPLWVEIRIPQVTQPGTYHSAIAVRDAAGNAGRTQIELTVRDIFLAAEDGVPILARVQLGPIIAAHTELDPENVKVAIANPDGARILRRVFTLLHEHGLSPYTDDVRPRLQQSIDGAVELDWSQYDAFCGPLIDGTLYEDKRPVDAWPIPADLKQPDPMQYNDIRSAVYASVLRDYLKTARAHFETKGWLDRAFVQFDLSDRNEAEADDYALVRQLATITHLAGDKLAFVSMLIPQPMAPFGWFGHHYEDLTDDVDIWSTPARYQHGPTLEQQRTLGKRTWLLPDRPPFSGSIAIEAAPILTRSLAWQAYLQGHDAIQLPYTTAWPQEPFKEPIDRDGKSSDTWLLYPGRLFGMDEPVPSVRLKQLQLGRQDYQYLRLLEKHGRGGTARLLAGSLIKAAGTDAYGDNYQDGLFGRRVEDPEIWALARSILEQEVAAAVASQPEQATAAADTQESWARLLSATRGIEVWAESARLSVDDRSTQGGYLLTFDVAVRNELRTPLEGKLSFGSMAAGLHSVSDIVRVGPLAEMSLARKQLVAERPQLPPCDLDGHYGLEIIFDAGLLGRIATRGIVSVVTVPRFAGPIKVDGDLSDWPPNEFNAIGDFHLLNMRKDGSAEGAQAESQTVAFIGQSEGMLLIGVHAAVPDVDGDGQGPQRHSNVVQYEDLMPLDDDLIEILIDPTNAGTQSSDLYHIVLKSTGDPVFERGVGTHPSIGQCQPWPGKPPEYCVATSDTGWSAEIAIPVASFGPGAAKNPIWGFNLTRLEPRRGEYSDWARAPRHCYDPRTLGNLVWSK
ncbi:MAG TPA: glycoside hydrolase domain-containing protein [Phycisphaerae bacterium]|nr:glycoside hydrolase domain-containing protein [Phycisphaerae bacterium]